MVFNAGEAINFGSMRKYYLVLLFLLIAIFSKGQNEEVINGFDSEQRKHGVWEVYYDGESDKQLRYRGQFEHGVPVGTFFYYYETGEKSSEVTHLGEGRSEARFFHKNGVLMGEGDYLGQNKEGEWRFFDSHTLLSSIEPYQNGKLNGTVKIYHLNGQLAAEVPYVDGLKNGAFKEYNTDGKVRVSGTYADNTFDGEYQQFYDDGSIYMKGYYKAAVKDSVWKYYNDDGYVMYQELYNVGELLKRKFEEGYSPEKIKVELEPEDVLNEDQLIEEFMNGTSRRR